MPGVSSTCTNSPDARCSLRIRRTLCPYSGCQRYRITTSCPTLQNGRGIALNRKNALFAGHDQGAENWACIASLVETCKLHGIDPQTYFTDALTKLVNLWPASRLDELMPWAWAAERAADKLAA